MLSSSMKTPRSQLHCGKVLGHCPQWFTCRPRWSFQKDFRSLLNKCPLVTSSTANSTASSEMRFFNLSTVRLETQTEALLKMVITHELVPFIFKNKPIISVLSFLYHSSTYQYWVPRKTLWSFQIPLSFRRFHMKGASW